MRYTKESQVSTVATLPHFLTSPSSIPVSSDIALSLFSLYPDDFLMPLPNFTCFQDSAFCNSPTMKLWSSFSATELILLFIQHLTFPKVFLPSMAYGHLYLEVQPLMRYVQYLIYHLLPKADTLFIFFLLLIYTYIF